MIGRSGSQQTLSELFLLLLLLLLLHHRRLYPSLSLSLLFSLCFFCIHLCVFFLGFLRPACAMASACFSSSVNGSLSSVSPRSDQSWTCRTNLLHTSRFAHSLPSLEFRSISLSASSRKHLHNRCAVLLRARAELSIGEVEALDSSLSTATDDEGAQSVLGGSVGESIPDYASAEESKLYVGNLPWSCTSEELAEVFQKVGGVEMVEVFLSSSSSV